MEVLKMCRKNCKEDIERWLRENCKELILQKRRIPFIFTEKKVMKFAI